MAVTKGVMLTSAWKKISTDDQAGSNFTVQHHEVSGSVWFAYTDANEEPSAADLTDAGKTSPGHVLNPGIAYSREFSGWFWMKSSTDRMITVTQ